jgi:hypothetical protein
MGVAAMSSSAFASAWSGRSCTSIPIVKILISLIVPSTASRWSVAGNQAA